MDRHVISAALIIFFSALLQSTFILSWGGIKVNLTLILIVLYLFFVRSRAEYALYAATAAVGLMVQGGLDRAVFGFIGMVIGVYVLWNILPWQSWLNYGFLLIAGTALLYLFIDWRFIVFMPFLFMREVMYTILCGSVLYAIAARWHERKAGRPF